MYYKNKKEQHKKKENILDILPNIGKYIKKNESGVFNLHKPPKNLLKSLKANNEFCIKCKQEVGLLIDYIYTTINQKPQLKACFLPWNKLIEELQNLVGRKATTICHEYEQSVTFGNEEELRERMIPLISNNSEDQTEVNKKIHDILSGIQQLPNPRYICCFQYFCQEWKLNPEQDGKAIILLPLNKALQCEELEKYLCAALNTMRGAYILIGVESDYKIKGTKISEQQKDIIITNTQKCIKKCIFPVLRDEERPIPSFIPRKSDSNQGYDYFFVRLKVQPLNTKILYYVKHPQKKAAAIYLIKKDGKEGVKKLQGEDLYHFLRKRFQSGKKKAFNRHICKAPLLGKFCSNSQNKLMHSQKDEKEKDKLIFKYKYSSFLIVSSQMKEELLQKFEQQMNKKKVKFLTIKRPFPNARNQPARLIWFISHEDRSLVLQDTKNKMDKNKQITLLSITDILKCHPNNKKIFLDLEQIHRSQFNTSFWEEQRSQKVDGQTMHSSYLRFSSLEQSAYAFIFFDSRRFKIRFQNQAKGPIVKQTQYARQ